MARGKKTGGRDFPPGVSGNPAGRKPMPREERDAWQQIKAMRLENRYDWQHHYRELVAMTPAQLQALVGGKTAEGTVIPSSEPDAPVLKLLVARSILYAMRTGKSSELSAHRDMMCGPEPKQVELSGPDGAPLSPLANYTQEQLSQAFTALDTIIKEYECKSTPSSPPPSESSAPSPPPSRGTAS